MLLHNCPLQNVLGRIPRSFSVPNRRHSTMQQDCIATAAALPRVRGMIMRSEYLPSGETPPCHKLYCLLPSALCFWRGWLSKPRGSAVPKTPCYSLSLTAPIRSAHINITLRPNIYRRLPPPQPHTQPPEKDLTPQPHSPQLHSPSSPPKHSP